jgi:hypothetical protein
LYGESIAKNIRELYSIAFSRAPTDDELATATKYVSDKPERIREAYEDLVWSVINSKEFLFVH